MRPDTLRDASRLSADKPHGTRVKYIGGCRCVPCRAANSRYQTQRVVAIAKGQGNGLVPTNVLREHLLALSAAGVGYKTAAAVAGVSKTTLFAVLSGRKKNVRRLTEQKVLRVNANSAAAGVPIDARKTWSQISTLLREGFTKADLAQRLGYKSPALQIGKKKVSPKNAKKVDAFYQMIMAGSDA